MTIASFLAAIVLGAVPAQAGPGPTARIDATLAAFKSGLDRVQQCFSTADSLKADLARKKAQYSAEYKGKVPPDFQELLGKKAARAARVQEACAKEYAELNGLYASARDSFVGVNTKYVDIKKQTAALQQLTQRYRALDRRGKPGGRGRPAAGTSSNASSDDGSQE